MRRLKFDFTRKSIIACIEEKKSFVISSNHKPIIPLPSSPAIAVLANHVFFWVWLVSHRRYLNPLLLFVNRIDMEGSKAVRRSRWVPNTAFLDTTRIVIRMQTSATDHLTLVVSLKWIQSHVMVINQSPSYVPYSFPTRSWGFQRNGGVWNLAGGIFSLTSHRACGKRYCRLSFSPYQTFLITLEQTSLNWLVCSLLNTNTNQRLFLHWYRYILPDSKCAYLYQYHHTLRLRCDSLSRPKNPWPP
jgi:hypothetical protein